jgi:1-acyl-sn-glycerol-3-phosphate acyltransferase
VKKPGVIQVAIGPPIDAAGRDPRELNEEVRTWIERRLASMTTEAGTIEKNS